MMVAIANRQQTRKVNTRLLKQITGELLAELKVAETELGINLVNTSEMTLVNESFLRHEGSTDVITFDHRNPESPILDHGSKIHGELFICVDNAVLQAKQYHTSWQSEVVRYVVHGVLHLLGHNDSLADLRREMKREETRLVRVLSRRFSLAQISRASKIGA